MVGVTKIQRGNAGYWLAAVAEGGDDYYTKPGEAPGEWVGDLAQELGLFGQVDPAGYTAILEGRDPTSGALLVQRPQTRQRLRADGSLKTIEPVLGYDVRFSAPKSVSLLYALGSQQTRERIVAVMNEAVRQGIAHLEQEACMVQRGKGGKIIERGEGFVGMAFRHRMSRAGDPALHVHVVISNLTRAASDGKWLSLASPKGRSPLFPHGKSAGVVFQAALRAGILREFGLEFETVKNGYADLKGFSRELIETFSTRSREIAALMAEHGVSGAKAAQAAAYRTRASKDHTIDADARLAEWEAQAAPLGFTRKTVEAMVKQAVPREPRPITKQDLARALHSLERTSSSFDSRPMLWALAEQLTDGADGSDLLAAVHEVLGSERIVRIHESTGLLDPAVYTTPRIAELEHRFIDSAMAGMDAGVGVVDAAAIDAALSRHSYLGEDQREMVIRLASGGEQVMVVAALPGTGKTSALAATVEAWTEAGYPVFGCATARTATGELIDAGVRNSFSIASLRHQVEVGGRRLPECAVIVVDEANVTSTFDLEALRSHVAELGGKLVLIGDSRQIGSIGPGGLFAHLARLIEPVSLTTIRRQRQEADQRIVTLVHEGRGSEALDLLRTEGKLIVGDNIISTLHGLLLDWHRDFASGADAVMIARRNRDVEYLNDQARELRRAEGKLGRLELIVGEKPIAAGDRVQTRLNNHQVDNRERWDVLSVNPITRSVKLRRVGGDRRTVKLRRDYLERQTRDGAPSLQYAYAVTKFGAESKTFDRAYPLLDPGSSLEQEVVAISRGQEVVNVYTVASSELLDPDLGPGRRDLSDILQDLRESIEREGSEPPALEIPLRKEIDSLSTSALADRRRRLVSAARHHSPAHAHRERLERAIHRTRQSLDDLAAERAAVEALAKPDAQEIASLNAKEINTAEALRRNEAELDGLPPLPGIDPHPNDPRDRLEALLIEERISNLARREVAAARCGDSDIIYTTLGPCPEDPAMAATWADAAHAIATYRLRHGVRDATHALGAGEPLSSAARAERQRVQRRIDAARRQQGAEHRRLEAANEIQLGR